MKPRESRTNRVWTYASDHATIENNRFERNGRVGIGQRIGGLATLQLTTNSSFSDNVGEENGASGLYVGGVVLYDSGRNTIARNFLRNTGEDNIWLRLGSGENEVIDNTLIGSLMDGIWIRESDDNHVAGNTCTDIDLYGIYVRSGRRNLIEGNRVTRAGRRAYGGIGIGGTTYASRDNVVFDNEVRLSLDGIQVHEEAVGNLFLENRLSGNHTGIRIGDGGASGNRFEGGSVIGSGAFTVFVSGDRCVTWFVDAPLDPEDIRFECYGDDCRVEVQWYVGVRVVDGGAPHSRRSGPPRRLAGREPHRTVRRSRVGPPGRPRAPRLLGNVFRPSIVGRRRARDPSGVDRRVVQGSIQRPRERMRATRRSTASVSGTDFSTRSAPT